MQTSTPSRRPRAEPDYAAALYEVRGPLFQRMDTGMRRAWRLVSRHTRDAVHECTRALAQQAQGTTTEDALRLLPRLPHLTHLDAQRMDTRLLPRLPPGLQSLALSCQGPAPQQQLSALAAFRALHTLSVECRGDIAPLRACTALATLHLQLFCIELPYSARALAALAGCPLLRTLRLQLYVEDDMDADNALDLSPLASFPALGHLSVFLIDNNVPLLPALPRSLHTLELTCCGGQNLLSCLSSCPSLHTLKLVHCQGIDNLSPLAHCPGLHTLHAKGCYSLLDISHVASCTALCEANFAGSTFRPNLTPLASCLSLRKLVISRTIPQSLDIRRLIMNKSIKVMYYNSYDRVNMDGVTAELNFRHWEEYGMEWEEEAVAERGY